MTTNPKSNLIISNLGYILIFAVLLFLKVLLHLKSMQFHCTLHIQNIKDEIAAKFSFFQKLYVYKN